MYVRQKYVAVAPSSWTWWESQEKSINNYPGRIRTTFVIHQDLVLRMTRENMGRKQLWAAGAWRPGKWGRSETLLVTWTWLGLGTIQASCPPLQLSWVWSELLPSILVKWGQEGPRSLEKVDSGKKLRYIKCVLLLKPLRDVCFHVTEITNSRWMK